MNYSFGKIRGLQTSANEYGVFTILALDHGVSLQKTIRPNAPETVTYAETVSLKATLLKALTPHASAVLLDPVYGLWPAVMGGALPGKVGLLVAVEDGDYADPVDKHGRIRDGWSVEKIKRLGASAVKISFYYHPDIKKTGTVQEDLVEQVVADCRRHDIPLFAEPLSYNVLPTDKPRVVIETARRISQLGVDVLKLEFPVDVNHQPDQAIWQATCEELSAACGQVPWTLLSAGVDFETFAEQVRVACRAGASGYLVGRAIWKEAAQLVGKAQQNYLQEITIPRLQKLAEIAAAQARPWTDFYPYSTRPAPEGWHKDYQEED